MNHNNKYMLHEFEKDETIWTFLHQIVSLVHNKEIVVPFYDTYDDMYLIYEDMDVDYKG
jgi:hypothetical protein